MRRSILHDLLERSVLRPDGRELSWVEHGDPAGTPILYFHGTPGCGSEAVTLARAANEHGVRIVAVNRPGFAGSTFQPDRTLLDWTDEAVAIADEIGVERIGVLGYSGGGPYALVCGAMRPDRFPRVGVAAGAAPFEGRISLARMNPSDRRMTLLALHSPSLGRAVLRTAGLVTAVAPGIGVWSWMAELPPADRHVLENEAIPARDAMHFLVDAMRHGAHGALLDYRLLSVPWGFDPATITVPVQWWHGLDDTTVPVAEIENITRAIPDIGLSLVPGAGHLLLSVVAGDVMSSLLVP